jgi:hypothetical protein
MTRKITNPKPLQKKSRTHEVIEIAPNTYQVISGTSGTSYQVSIVDNGATCTCKWAQYRKHDDPRSGCSHVQAAYTSHTGRKASAWNDPQQAKRQHRPSVNIGDGVILTTRKTPAK